MSTIAVAKRAANWQHPSQRNACSNCQHVKREPHPKDIGKAQWTCKKLGIFVLAYSLCDYWEQRR